MPLLRSERDLRQSNAICWEKKEVFFFEFDAIFGRFLLKNLILFLLDFAYSMHVCMCAFDASFRCIQTHANLFVHLSSTKHE